MVFVYNLVIYLYNFLIRLSSPFNKKAKLWLSGRKGLFKQLNENIDRKSKIAWFHCASLGEFEQGRPVIEEFKKHYPAHKILLTFFSPSGYEIRKNYTGADYIFYMPIDTKRNVKQFLNIVNPSIAFFVKYEFWYHYLKQLKIANVPIYIFSANFREEQMFFKSYGKWYRNMLKYYNHIFVQNKKSLQLLNSINITNVTISGDTRFDRVFTIAYNSKEVPQMKIFKDDKILFIAGSTWGKDIDIIAKYINETKKNIKFIIAPHEINDETIRHIYDTVTKTAIKLSQVSTSDLTNYDVLIIDNIGMLSSLYKYSEIAYIGGGFGKGIHNILEAATFGVPVVFGPNYHKFIEAKELIKAGGGYTISSFEEFENTINDLISNKEKLSNASEVAKSYVENNVGATKVILNEIKF